MPHVGGSSSTIQVDNIATPPPEPAAAIWSYFNAGANANVGRDPSVGPLDGRNH